jgi:hypothetical protein
MLRHAPASLPQADANLVRIGVGIGTSRYGHYAAFLRVDLQPASASYSSSNPPTAMRNCARVWSRSLPHFAVRLDVANQYADNLLNFLHTLQARFANATLTISCGDPKRNKRLPRRSLRRQESDPIEARAAARYALSEQPAPVKMLPPELRTLRQIAGRLQAVVRHRTRLINHPPALGADLSRTRPARQGHRQ